MEKIAYFQKVSKQNFVAALTAELDVSVEAAETAYKSLALPRRATTGSAGYDFYMPVSITLQAGQTVKVPTGIRAHIAEGWVLCLFPRSGLGFKYRLQLDNTVGVIDSDYYCSDNEGHIFCKITNDGKQQKTVTLHAGDGFVQGIFLPFGITEDDAADGKRNGGFGSTSSK